MPTVKKGPKDLKKFPYTKKGIADAKAYAKKTGGVVMNSMKEIESQKKDVLKNIAKAKGSKIPMRFEGKSMKDLPSEPEIMMANYKGKAPKIKMKKKNVKGSY